MKRLLGSTHLLSVCLGLRKRLLAKGAIVILLFLLSVLGVFFGYGASNARAAEPPQMTNEACLGCHQNPGLSMALGNGEKLSLTIDKDIFSTSVHGTKVTCASCHTEITAVPHTKLTVSNRRGFQIQRYDACKNCHFSEYTKTLDSTHYQQLTNGNLQAPICSDCHGAHDVKHPQAPRSAISQTCAQCHRDVNELYARSVHGKALVGEGNGDVPVCTSCHGVHNMEDPRTAHFRLQSPEMCASCHADPQMMNKYNISTEVFRTYTKDFHGVTVGFYEKQDPNIWSQKAVCTDCHGVHSMKKVDDPELTVIKANLVKTCQNCHPDATDNFPTAWLMHYEPSPTKFPLVYFVRMFYWVAIPIFVAGVSLHVILDLWRALTSRRRQGGGHAQ